MAGLNPKNRTTGRCPAGEIKIWYVYILRCKGSTLYTGITTDLKRRFQEHRSKGARYTRYNPPVKIVYSERCETRSEATKRECAIKRWNRAKKLELVGRTKNHRHHPVEKTAEKRFSA